MPSLTTIQGKLLLLVATLVTAILSFHWLAVPWVRWTIAGHTFPVWRGIFPTEDFVQSLPFTWPFAVAGFLLGFGLATIQAPLRWLLLFGLLGAVTYGLLTGDVFTETHGMLSTYGVRIYTRAGMPLLLELLGLLAARLGMEV